MHEQKAHFQSEHYLRLSKLWFYLLFFNVALNFACHFELFDKNQHETIVAQDVCGQSGWAPIDPSPSAQILFASKIIGVSNTTNSHKKTDHFFCNQQRTPNTIDKLKTFPSFKDRLVPIYLKPSSSPRGPPLS